MATEIASASWVVTFERESFTDDTIYTVTFNAKLFSRDLADDVAAALKKKGYKDVRVALVETL